MTKTNKLRNRYTESISSSEKSFHSFKSNLSFCFNVHRVRVWDVLILVPNVMFLLYLMFRFNRARLKLRATSSPIFFTFYVLVSINDILLSVTLSRYSQANLYYVSVVLGPS